MPTVLVARVPFASMDEEHMKVRLAEDEAAIADTLQRGLTAEGFVTKATMNGIDGLSIAEENEFDVIILDLCSPSYPRKRHRGGCARAVRQCRS